MWTIIKVPRNPQSTTVAKPKKNFRERFSQLHKMETFLSFITSAEKSTFKDLDLSWFSWLKFWNLKIQWPACDLNVLSGKELQMKSLLVVLKMKVWNYLPDNFKSMKALVIALLILFWSSYACEHLFSALNHIKFDARNRLMNDMSAACVALKLTYYEPRIDKLSTSMQHQKPH